MVFQNIPDADLLEGENRLGKKQESNLSFKVVWEFCILEETLQPHLRREEL
jgi:hypothetical protein